MRINFTKRRSSNQWEFIVSGEETILNPLKKKLAENKDVSFVSYNKPHPQIDEIKFIIKGKKIKSAVKKALGDLKSELNSFTKHF